MGGQVSEVERRREKKSSRPEDPKATVLDLGTSLVVFAACMVLGCEEDNKVEFFFKNVIIS